VRISILPFSAMLTCPLGLPVISFVSDHLRAKSPAKGLLWYAIALRSSEV